MRTLTPWIIAAVLAGVLVMPVLAEGQGPRAGERQGPVLTEEQRAAVKALLEKFREDMKPLREAVRTEIQKLRELRQSEAGEEAIKAQIAVIKTKVEAAKARFEQFKTDLKAAVPQEVYDRILQRLKERKEQFLDNHPMLKERLEKRQERRQQNKAGAAE